MRKRLVRVLSGTAALAVACVTAAACTPLGTAGAMSGAYAKNIWGPDVSSYQHPNGAAINWTLVRKQGAKFAFIKVNEGSTYTNPYASNDIKQARAAGLYVGAYHFARPRQPLTTSASDARAFAAKLGDVRQSGFLPPVLDIESTGGMSAARVTAWTHSFLVTLEGATKRVPIIYSGAWFWKGYMGNPKGFSHYPIWAAQYSANATSPNLFGDFAYSTFWQYTDTHSVWGIHGGVDASWFHGSLAQLASLAWIASSVNVTSSRTALDVNSSRTSLSTEAGGSAVKTGAHMAQSPLTVGAK